MIAADTSAWIDYAKGAVSDGAAKLEVALVQERLVIPVPVLFEILSGPGLTAEARAAVNAIPRLEAHPGYWERAAAMRATLLKRGLKARAMDCLIAQICIDHDVALISSDGDFRHLTRHGLKRA